MRMQEQQMLYIQEGATISHAEKQYVILSVADINLVLAKEVGTDIKTLIKIGDVAQPKIIGDTVERPPEKRELLSIPEETWELAEEKLRLIRPLVNNQYRHSGALADQIAAEAGVNRATIYRWLAAYRSSGQLSSLISNTSERGGKGKGRISPEVEAIIADAIENFHNTDQCPTIATTVEEIRRRCSNANLKLPAVSTIRNRLEWTDGRERLLRPV